MLRSLNNITRSLLFQACLPASYWVEALHTATHLISHHPTKTLQHHTLSLPSMVHTPPTPTYECLVASVTLTYPPPLPTN
jgi:hypothetical protein